tara:strand:+ start:2036 stop:3733 length:1698 start_codon:yes stop_codon:yes gene_type:complete
VSDRPKEEQYFLRLEQMQNRRKPYEDNWQETSDLVNPRRSMWDDRAKQHQTTAKVGTKIFSSKAMRAREQMVNGLTGYNAGPNIDWQEYRVGIHEFNQIPYVKDWLSECDEIVSMAYHSFGFYDANEEFINDLITIGHGGMLVEEDIANRAIIYRAMHPKEYWIAESPNGRVETLYRKVWYTALEAFKRYGARNLPHRIVRDAEDSPLTEYPFLHCIFPRADALPKGMVMRDDTMPFASVELDFEEKAIVKETGYMEFPGAVCRWAKNSDEWYAHSPATDAISEIKKTNVSHKSLMQAAQKAANPALMVPEELRGKENLLPGGHTYYTRANRPIQQIDQVGEYPIARDILEMWDQAIEEHFHTQLFLALTSAQRQMTATEIVERQGERVAILSGPLSKQNTEYYGPVARRTFNICMRMGWLPPPPPALLAAWFQKTGGRPTIQKPIEVEFVGLLAQAQKRYQSAQGVDSSLSKIMAIGERVPEVMDRFDFDDLSVHIAESGGWPQSSIREDPEVDQIREARQAQIEEAKQLQQAQMAASTAKDMADAQAAVPQDATQPQQPVAAP